MLPENRDGNCYHVVTASLADITAVLNGVTISGGNANESGLKDLGGGVHNRGGSFTFRDCILTGNAAVSGAGMYSYGYLVNARMIDCTIAGNYALSNGGGLYDGLGTVRLTNCLIVDNTAYYGGAYYCDEALTEMNNCTIADNLALAGGGALVWGGTPRFTNCIFWGNAEEGPGGTEETAQMWLAAGAPVLTNTCLQGWTGDLGGDGQLRRGPALRSGTGGVLLPKPDSRGRCGGQLVFRRRQ